MLTHKQLVLVKETLKTHIESLEDMINDCKNAKNEKKVASQQSEYKLILEKIEIETSDEEYIFHKCEDIFIDSSSFQVRTSLIVYPICYERKYKYLDKKYL